MRRPLGYLLAWTAATAVAVAGSWVGLQPLLAAAAAERPPSVEIQHLREMATWGPDASGTPAPGSANASTSPAPGRISTPTPPPEPTPPVTTPEPTVAEPTAAEPTAAGPTSGTGWEEVPDRRAVRRTFVVQGGEVVVEVGRRDVEVISYEANGGFEASVNRWDRQSVVVSFTSDSHTSRVWVQWRNRPYAEITESV